MSTAPIRRWFKAIIAFSDKCRVVWEAKEAPPHGVVPEVLIIDESGSMGGWNEQASTAAAELTNGTNAADKFEPMRLGPGTGMIACIEKYKDMLQDCHVYLIGDGGENMFSGTLTMPDGSQATLQRGNSGTEAYEQTCAAYVTGVCGIQFIMVTFGEHMERISRYYVGRRNVYVCNIPSHTGRRAVMATLRATIARANSVRAARVANEPEPAPQQAVLMPVSPEAEELIANIPEAEEAAVRAVADTVRFVQQQSLVAQPPPPPTAEDVKEMFHEAEAKVLKDVALTTEETNLARAIVLAYMRFCSEINDGKGLPATFISGLKAHSRVALYEADLKFGQYFNKLLAALSKTKALSAAGKVPDGGLKLESQGLKFSFAKQTTMYTTEVPKDVIAALQADGEFALAESQLKKRSASTGSPGRVVRQRTDAGSPTTSAAAAAPAAAAMDETAATS